MTATELSNQNLCGETSTSSIAATTGIPKATVWRTMRKDLRMFPYRISTLHQLEPGDPDRRLHFAQEFLTRVELEEQFLDQILWSDEAHFTLSGRVNTQNCRIWAQEHPHAFVQQPLHDEKVTVWAGMTSTFLIGPYFFQEEDDNGVLRTTTVNGHRYLIMLQEFVFPTLQALHAINDVVFMQDGATPHVTIPVKAFLLAQVGANRIISRAIPGAMPRPPDHQT